MPANRFNPTTLPIEVQKAGGTKPELLKSFMQEFFPYREFREAGFFTKAMRGDYYAQAYRVCQFFGYETVYEYGAKETRAHITYADGKRPADAPFTEVRPSIYES